MLRIERMRIHLPPGYEHRASSIARRLGDSLAALHTPESRSLGRLSVGPIQIPATATDDEIAHSVAERIASKLGERA